RLRKHRYRGYLARNSSCKMVSYTSTKQEESNNFPKSQIHHGELLYKYSKGN
ncbi:hypothetical protein SK128_025658, partial [Halocaridina rubra]